MKNRVIATALILVAMISTACLFSGGSKISQSSPENAVEGVLQEASKGNESGIYEYAIDGINSYGSWPGDLLYYCRGINMDKDIYQLDNFTVTYSDDTHADVIVSTGKVFTSSVTFKTEEKEGKWYIVRAPGFFEIGKLCDK